MVAETSSYKCLMRTKLFLFLISLKLKKINFSVLRMGKGFSTILRIFFYKNKNTYIKPYIIRRKMLESKPQSYIQFYFKYEKLWLGLGLGLLGLLGLTLTLIALTLTLTLTPIALKKIICYFGVLILTSSSLESLINSLFINVSHLK